MEQKVLSTKFLERVIEANCAALIEEAGMSGVAKVDVFSLFGGIADITIIYGGKESQMMLDINQGSDAFDGILLERLKSMSNETVSRKTEISDPFDDEEQCEGHSHWSMAMLVTAFIWILLFVFFFKG